MKSLLIHATLIWFVFGFPQRGAPSNSAQCTCKDVICPNNRDACDCLNKAAQDCFRTRRSGQCPSPVAANCNYQAPRGTARPPANNGGPPTVYVTKGLDGRQTVTTVYPGQGNRQTVTVTQSRRPPPNQPQETWPAPWEQPQGTTRPRQTPPPTKTTTRPRPPPPPPPPTTTRAPRPTSELPPRSSSSRPGPWVPPAAEGSEPIWTPVNEPVLPVEQPQPTASPPEVPVQPASPRPKTGQGSQKCGPSFGKCAAGTYCDPQPLCSIGEDCDGVCFASVTMRGVELPNSKMATQQPWKARRKLWQKLLDDGQYTMYQYNIRAIQAM